MHLLVTNNLTKLALDPQGLSSIAQLAKRLYGLSDEATEAAFAAFPQAALPLPGAPGGLTLLPKPLVMTAYVQSVLRPLRLTGTEAATKGYQSGYQALARKLRDLSGDAWEATVAKLPGALQERLRTRSGIAVRGNPLADLALHNGLVSTITPAQQVLLKDLAWAHEHAEIQAAKKWGPQGKVLRPVAGHGVLDVLLREHNMGQRSTNMAGVPGILRKIRSGLVDTPHVHTTFKGKPLAWQYGVTSPLSRGERTALMDAYLAKVQGR